MVFKGRFSARKTLIYLIPGFQFIHGFSTCVAAIAKQDELTSEEFAAIMVSSAMNMLFAVVLTVGIYKAKPPLLLAWVGWAIIFVIFYFTCLLLLMIFFHDVLRNYVPALVFSLITIFIVCCCTFIVWNSYMEMRRAMANVQEGKEESRPSSVSTICSTKTYIATEQKDSNTEDLPTEKA